MNTTNNDIKSANLSDGQVQYIEDLAVVLSGLIPNVFLKDIADQIIRGIILTQKQHQAVLEIIWQNAKILQLTQNAQIVAKNRRVKITDLTYCARIAHNFLTFNHAKLDILDCLSHRFPELIIRKRYRDYYLGNILPSRTHILDMFASYGYTIEQQNTFDNIFEMEN